ncbi:MAG: suppressor of fused domain protein [Herpetosiphonaceae bacterium]|nr:suppressor of fused domain protein [Herpetosiphonaceae bacterium]
MDDEARDTELINHYTKFLGQRSCLFEFKQLDPPSPNPIIVLEFPPRAEGFDWVYVTVGAGRKPMPKTKDPKHRVEFLLYSRQCQAELAHVLAQIAAYPFVNNTLLAAGHTIAGTSHEGVIPGSPLTEFLITPVYFEAEDFDTIRHTDGTHTEVLWATPLYLSERMFVKERGWKVLVEELFIEHEVEPADLWRARVI